MHALRLEEECVGGFVWRCLFIQVHSSKKHVFSTSHDAELLVWGKKNRGH